MNIVAVIPVRKNSKGIPSKNLRMLNGKTLIERCIQNAQSSHWIDKVVVSTDDEEIILLCEKYKVLVVERPLYLAKDEITLDPVVNHAVLFLERMFNETVKSVVTLQATSPLLKTKTLDTALEYYMNNPEIDTLISVVNRPHLAWKKEGENFIPLYNERKNRQWLPGHYMETGAFLISKRANVRRNCRIGNKVAVYEIPAREAVDIDTMEDIFLCESILKQKYVVFYISSNAEKEYVQVFRCLAIARQMCESQVVFVVDKKYEILAKIINDHNYNCVRGVNILKAIETLKPDVLVNDVGDTKEDEMKQVKKYVNMVINIEDIGEGAGVVDYVVNYLHQPQNSCNNFMWGDRYSILQGQFYNTDTAPFNEIAKNVIVYVNYSDPNSSWVNRIRRIIRDKFADMGIVFYFILQHEKNVDKDVFNNYQAEHIVDIINEEYITKYLKIADFAISQYGQEMLELASMQIPTILIRNENNFYDPVVECEKKGFIEIGDERKVSDELLESTIKLLIENTCFRKKIKEDVIEYSVYLKKEREFFVNLIRK